MHNNTQIESAIYCQISALQRDLYQTQSKMQDSLDMLSKDPANGSCISSMLLICVCCVQVMCVIGFMVYQKNKENSVKKFYWEALETFPNDWDPTIPVGVECCEWGECCHGQSLVYACVLCNIVCVWSDLCVARRSLAIPAFLQLSQLHRNQNNNCLCTPFRVIFVNFDA